MEKTDKFLNDSQDRSRLARNYFFAGTAAVILTNICLFAIGGSGWGELIKTDSGLLDAGSPFYRIVRSLMNCFAHESGLTLLLNMICFGVCGFYLERKTGTIKWIALTAALVVLTSLATTANYLSVEWSGFSVVNYGLFAYIIVEYLFSLNGKTKTRFSLIAGAAVIGFMYIAMSFNGGVFFGYPRGLVYNLGHYTGFLVGLLLCLTIMLFTAGGKKWLTKNYFFAGTAAVIVINILIFTFGGSDWQQVIGASGQTDWNSFLSFGPLVRAFLNAFSHLNWAHVLNNARAMLVCGLYLERKTGSAKLVLMIILLAFFTGTISTAATFSLNWSGFSGIVYLLFAYVLVDYLFSFRPAERNRLNIILGAVCLSLIYIFMCGGLSFDPARELKWYPYILIFHSGHMSGFITGMLLGLAVQLYYIAIQKRGIPE